MASLTESECSVFEDPDFWLYYQQITLYNVLSARQPMFMRRNLKYVHKAKPAQGQDGEGSYTIEVTIHAAAGSVRGKSSVPPGLSLIVAVCERLSNGLDLNPVAARLLRLPSWDQTRVPGSEISNGEAGGSGGAADVSVRLSVPCTMHQPQIVFAVADAAPDFGGCFGKRNACTLTKCLNAGVCLGVFRPGDAVWTGTVPLDETSL
ncbi:hypothetical protein FOA52_011651 [Chlamydomonas sp. UWO 241]|nr:hypothetical protein FOA52_011651 [Chlamydomonas sp. UWO 241]